MKITEIKTYPVWVGQRNQMIVKVETDEGLHGWGEAGVSGREMAVVGAVRHYGEFLDRTRSAVHGRVVARDVPQPVFRRRAHPDRRDLGDRHRAL